MIRKAPALIVGLFLAGCAAGPAPEIKGEVEFGGETYPIIATPRGWSVVVDMMPVDCRAMTETDCYWALRNHLNAQDLLDDIPG